MTVDCPLDCVYLQEARKHERPQPVNPVDVPNKDIRVTDEFLANNSALASFTMEHLAKSALQVPGVIDFDVRETLESLIKTMRTEQSGLYYESRPANALATNLYVLVQAGIADYRRAEQQQLGMARTRDTDVLGVLCFLQRLELLHNNGRRRGRSFINMMQAQIPPEPQAPPPPATSLILP